MSDKKKVSAFEFAIMQAAHESDPTRCTQAHIDAVRPETELEAKAAKVKKFDEFVSRVKTKDGSKAKIIY